MDGRIPLARPSWTEGMRNAAIATLDSGQWVKGPHGRAFAQEFAEYCQVSFAAPCNSGSGALIAALRLLNVGIGDEVIVPSMTFIATATSVSMVGATPVFADVDPDYWCLDVEDVRKRITEKTKAVIGVHLFGQTYDPALIELCERNRIGLIEDAAQAHGTSMLINGERRIAGSLGDIACFSFFPSKNMAVGGEGGMITTNNEAIGSRMRSIINHGRDGTLQSQEVGTNMRMSEVFAAIGRKQLEHLDQWLEIRRNTAEQYASAIEKNRLISAPSKFPDSEHGWHQYCVKVEESAHFIAYMSEKNIDARVFYSTPCHQHPVYATHSQHSETLKITESICTKLVAVPIHHGLTDKERSRVASALENYA
jgi:perosamine synthetase